MISSGTMKQGMDNRYFMGQRMMRIKLKIAAISMSGKKSYKKTDVEKVQSFRVIKKSENGRPHPSFSSLVNFMDDSKLLIKSKNADI